MNSVEKKIEEKVIKALGGVVPLGYRERFAEWRNTGGELFVPYDIVRHPGFYTWLLQDPDIDFHDGAEGIRLWQVRFGRIGHAESDGSQC